MPLDERVCRQVLETLDSYVDGTLEPESRCKMDDHMAFCPRCAEEAAARSTLRRRLREAVLGVSAPPYLATRIRAQLNGGERRSRFRWLLPAAATMAVCASAIVMVRPVGVSPAKAQDTFIAAVSDRLVPLLRVGLGDHLHCTVFRKNRLRKPTVEQIATDMGPDYKELAAVVEQHAPKGFTLITAHRCSFRGRRFVHLALEGEDGLLSLVITRKEAGESLAAVLKEQGGEVYRDSAGPFRLAAYETPGHLAFAVSEITGERNAQFLIALTPDLQRVLANVEG